MPPVYRAGGGKRAITPTGIRCAGQEARGKARGGGGHAAAVDPYLLRAHEAPNQVLVARKSAQAERDSAWSTAAARPPPPLAAYHEHHHRDSAWSTAARPHRLSPPTRSTTR